ncbi:ABC transporter substrate-binding protein [Roseofilum casamattae]|uniref:ABC transporter substrate-binding protein n=1 Tax=Roseofilum casamattae BLCC-M143 TaxID=3022442 RepID=A0ABT7BTW9_9CYAN|nr:ABC transporter substrate-binding protein [Roseofilum casamattae]MDJ1181969.1 ABC transporter substrate-binding protein [Roseofilum casamattae BLCC-M143]
MNNLNSLNRRDFLRLMSLACGSGFLAACTSPNLSSQPSDNTTSVRFALSWKAEAEYGGFYQALATGIYQTFGLDVTIRPINPQTNNTQLLLGNVIDLTMGGSLSSIKAVAEDLPLITVAAIFQKEIQVLLSHPNVGNNSLSDLKGKPIFIAPSSRTSFWQLLKTKYGFSDTQIRSYNFNAAPFLKNKNSSQQGILTSEPYLIEKEGGFKPIVHLLQDSGYNPYAFTINTTKALVNHYPDVVDRFVDASIVGWYSYLDDPAPGNELIKQDNPDMTDELLAYGLKTLKEYGIITSGDAAHLGIGAMIDQRWQKFFSSMVEIGLFDRTVDYRKAYTLQFVNKGVDYYQSYRT